MAGKLGGNPDAPQARKKGDIGLKSQLCLKGRQQTAQ
jgi:hypothetical protein